jgi:hypothetical protein
VISEFHNSQTSASNGLLVMSLTLTHSDESVTLLNQIHVDSTP